MARPDAASPTTVRRRRVPLPTPRSSDEPPSPEPKSDQTQTLTPYTFSYLLLDLSPIALYVAVYVLLWLRGWRVVPLLLPLLQVCGAVYVFVLLRSEMRPAHWTNTIAGAASMTLHVSAPLKPVSMGEASRARQHPHRYFEQLRAQPVNPLLHSAWKINSTWERMRLSAMAVTLVPIRAFATVSILVVLCGILNVVLWHVPPEDRVSKPLPPRRAAFLAWLIRLFSRTLLLFGFGYSRLLGSVEDVNDQLCELDPRVAPVVVCNHTSFVDPILLVTKRLVSAVGAVDNLTAPIIGTICQAIQTITVDRRDDKSRSKVVAEIRARAQWADVSAQKREELYGPGAASHVWPQILLFPEGTCTNGEALIGFKQGAFVPKRPVQPVTIEYLWRRYPLARFHPSWTAAGPNLLVTLFRMWAEPLNYARLSHLAVMTPTAHEMRPEVDCFVFAHRVRRAMAAHLRVPVTEHTYEDVVLQDSALAIAEQLANDANDSVGDSGKEGKGSKQEERKEEERAHLLALSSPSMRNDDGSVTHVAHSLVGDPSVGRHLRASSQSSSAAAPSAPLPLLTYPIEVGRLCDVFDVDLETVQRHLARFQQMDVQRRGRVNFEEFLRFFHIDPRADAEAWSGSGVRGVGAGPSPMRRLFDLLDEDESGSLDVREFLVGLALLAEADPGKPNAADMEEATLRLAFAMFDREGKGRVRIADLRNIFRRAFPDVADQVVQQMCDDAERGSGSGSGDDGITYQQFVDFCHAHPECVAKFRQTILHSPQE